jgi:hypothetical protein
LDKEKYAKIMITKNLGLENNRPGDYVETIVLIKQGMESERKGSQSFLDAIAGIEIDAPADYSTAFEDQPYANPRDS